MEPTIRHMVREGCYYLSEVYINKEKCLMLHLKTKQDKQSNIKMLILSLEFFLPFG